MWSKLLSQCCNSHLTLFFYSYAYQKKEYSPILLCRLARYSFWQNWKIVKMAIFNLYMKFKNILGQKTFFETLLKCHILKISITCPKVRQIQDLGQSKYKLRIFSKGLTIFIFFLFNLGSYEYLARLESKIGRCPFFWYS